MLSTLRKTTRGLTDAQKKILETVGNGNEYRTVTDLCSAAGIARITYYNSLKDENFRSRLIEASKEQLHADLPQIMRQVVKQAKRGSFPHAKLYLETIGITKEEQTNINVGFQVVSNVPQPVTIKTEEKVLKHHNEA